MMKSAWYALLRSFCSTRVVCEIVSDIFLCRPSLLRRLVVSHTQHSWDRHTGKHSSQHQTANVQHTCTRRSTRAQTNPHDGQKIKQPLNTRVARRAEVSVKELHTNTTRKHTLCNTFCQLQYVFVYARLSRRSVSVPANKTKEEITPKKKQPRSHGAHTGLTKHAHVFSARDIQDNWSV